MQSDVRWDIAQDLRKDTQEDWLLDDLVDINLDTAEDIQLENVMDFQRDTGTENLPDIDKVIPMVLLAVKESDQEELVDTIDIVIAI